MDDKKRVVVLGAGRIGQHLAQSLNAENHARQMVEDAKRMGFEVVPGVHGEMILTPLDALREGIKAHEDAVQAVEAWREAMQQPPEVATPEFVDVPPGSNAPGKWRRWASPPIKGGLQNVPPMDLNAIEQRLVAHGFMSYDPASKSGDRSCAMWYQHDYPARKPDRQPRGKCFVKMMKLGYVWSGKL